MKVIGKLCGILCCTLLVSLMSACGDKVAEDLAHQLIAVADSYQAQVDRTNEAERKAYKKLASTYVDAQRNDIFLSLGQERIERSGKIADEAVEVKQTPLTLSEIERQLREYAQLDFETTRKLMKDESEARAQYLGQLAKLSSDSAKVEALSKSFAALAKSKSRTEQVKEIISYYEETKKEFDKLFCEDLTAKIGSVQKQVDAQKPPAGEKADDKAKRLARLEALQAELDALTKQKAAKKCT